MSKQIKTICDRCKKELSSKERQAIGKLYIHLITDTHVIAKPLYDINNLNLCLDCYKKIERVLNKFFKNN